MKVAYRAFDKAGRTVQGTLDASDRFEADERLRQQGLLVAELSENRAAAGATPGRAPGAAALRAPRSRGRILRNLAMFTRQLQVLITTGTPLVQSLMALERQSEDTMWRAIIEDVRTRVEEGATLSEALERHPACFDAVYRGLIAAGESGGQLESMLARLSSLTRQQARLRSALLGALIYPALLLCVAVVVLGVMVGVLLPQFAGLYDSLDAPLPPTTRILLGMGDVLRGGWWVILGAAVVGGVALRFWMRSEPGRESFARAAVGTPPVGRVVRSLLTARLMRVLGVLLESHVPLHQALRIGRGAVGNRCFERLVTQAEDAVTRGEPMSSAFAASPLVSAYVAEAIRSGEQSGQVGPLLVSVADFLDEENEVVVRSLMSILEPIILIVLGVLVGAVALSMFMPLFDLTAMTDGGGG
jgi:type II secretory pathway component PulF